MKRLTISAVLMILLSSCAVFDSGRQAAGPGQAVYHYIKSADGSCEVIITSAREVPGIVAQVDENCAVTVKAEALSGEKLQIEMMSVMGSLLNKLP